MHTLGGVRIGGTAPVRIMGILNVSPESFMKSSVSSAAGSIAAAAVRMEDEGADFIDVGGMSTAPCAGTAISQDEEVRRVTQAIRTVQDVSSLPISVDTPRSAVAEEALDAGAVILNDITGLQYDWGMADVIERYLPSLILCAHSPLPLRGNPVSHARLLLRGSVDAAEEAGADPRTISVDPAIGFFRRRRGRFFTRTDLDWVRRDVLVLQNLQGIKQDLPVTVSVSNKSFIGRLMGAPDPADRLPGSLAFEAMSVLMGADVVRTHNVAQTREAVRTAERMRR